MLVSTIRPIVKGRSDSREKYLMTWGRPFSATEKSSLVRSLTIWPDLALTVARMLTTLTSVEKVASSWPGVQTETNRRSAAVYACLQKEGTSLDYPIWRPVVLGLGLYCGSTSPLKYRCSIDGG